MSNHHLALPEFHRFFTRVVPTPDYWGEADRNADYLALERLICIHRVKYRVYEHYFLNASFSDFRASTAKSLNPTNVLGQSHEEFL